jgi:NTE family protein
MQQLAARAPDSPSLERSVARTGYERIALVLQGGGALGAYQGGVYEGLYEAGIEPDWIAGISIGAVNAALIVGNAHDQRVARLREFWNLVCEPAYALPLAEWAAAVAPAGASAQARDWSSLAHATESLWQGRLGLFVPRVPAPWAGMPGDPGTASFYDNAPLAATLSRLVDFERVNMGEVRLAVGAVNVRTGNFVYFDSAEMPLGAVHVMASCALPPGFAAVEIDGEHYWDGGLVSNTPLEYVLDTEPRRDTLAFQVDLWSARGAVPKGVLEVLEREKDIRFSSRTRRGTDALANRQKIRRAIDAALARLPAPLRDEPSLEALRTLSCTKVMNVVHLIYRAKTHEGHYKDYEFSRAAMEAHWRAGLEDTRRTLAQPGVLDRPPPGLGVVTHDVHRAQDTARRAGDTAREEKLEVPT